MQNKIRLSLVSVSLISSLYAENRLELKPLTVTSTAIETTELKSTDAVEVYTAQDIENAHVQNVYEFLNSQTSVISMPSYGNPFVQKLDFHGYGIGNGYQNIVVTLNGRKINNIDMVAPLLSAISPSSIGSIEIIKSSGVVTGGDGANAGVINIITKKSDAKELTVYRGTHGNFNESLYLSHNTEKLSVSGSTKIQSSEGIRNIDSQNKDESKLSTAAFELSYTPIEELELRVSSSMSKTDVTYGGTLTKAEYNENPIISHSSTHQLYDTNALGAGVSYYVNDELSINVDGYKENKKSEYVNSFTAEYRYKSAKTSIDYNDNFLTVSTGMDVFNGERDSHATAWGIANTTVKDKLSGFLAAQIYFDHSTLKAGYRYEKVNYEYSDATQSFSEKSALRGSELGYNYVFDKQTSIFANYSHSYQAPDIDRFFNKDWSGVVSFNGFIEPMKTNSYTVGFNNIQANNKFKISAYYVALKNEIYYYPGVAWVGAKNTNIDKSHKYGFDFYDKLLISDELSVVFNYNYVQAVIDTEEENGDNYSGNKLPGVSNHNAKATITYLPTQNIAFALTQAYRSKAFAANDFNNNFTQKQDAYKSTDISASYVKGNYEVFAKINNLFMQKNGLWIADDQIYPVNFTRTAIAGLKLRF